MCPISPVDGLAVPAVVAVAGWCEVVIVTGGVGQIRPELLGILDLLADFLHEFVEPRLAVVVVSVAVCVSLVAVVVAAVVASSAVRLTSISGVVVDCELEGRLDFDFLVISPVFGVRWVGSAL